VRSDETVVQLQIDNATKKDAGDYQVVAKTEGGGEVSSRKVSLSEMELSPAKIGRPEDNEPASEANEKEKAAAEALKADGEEQAVKKKKKKVVKKKKKEKEEVIPAPEVVSFLKNQILQEGQHIELQCRLDEEMPEGKGKVTWLFNEKVLEESESVMLTFDGTWAKLLIAQYVLYPALLITLNLHLLAPLRMTRAHTSASSRTRAVQMKRPVGSRSKR